MEVSFHGKYRPTIDVKIRLAEMTLPQRELTKNIERKRLADLRSLTDPERDFLISLAQRENGVSRNAMDHLIFFYTSYIRSKAKRIARQFPNPCCDRDDLFQEGCKKFEQLVVNFKKNNSKNSSFMNYAASSLQLHLLEVARREFAKSRIAPRHVLKENGKIERTKNQLTQKLERCPTQAELAKKLGVTPAKLQLIALSLRKVLSLDQPPSSNEEDSYLYATIRSGSAVGNEWAEAKDPLTAAEEQEVREKVSAAVKGSGLSPLQADTLEKHFVGEMTLHEIGISRGVRKKTARAASDDLRKNAFKKIRTGPFGPILKKLASETI